MEQSLEFGTEDIGILICIATTAIASITIAIVDNSTFSIGVNKTIWAYFLALHGLEIKFLIS